MSEEITRRHFFQALAASAMAAAVPLPIGFPKETIDLKYYLFDQDAWFIITNPSRDDGWLKDLYLGDSLPSKPSTSHVPASSRRRTS